MQRVIIMRSNDIHGRIEGLAHRRNPPGSNAARGPFHLSGARMRDGGYARAEWGLRPECDLPYIMGEVIEDWLGRERPVRVTVGRLE